MTQDEIIEMANKASKEWLKELPSPEETANPVPKRFLEIFYKLAVSKEREACAEIAEKQRYAMFISLTSHPAQNGTAVGIANAIIARGQE